MKTLRWSWPLLLAGLLSTCRPVPDPAAQFRALLDESRAFLLRENPLTATYVGVHTYDDRLPSPHHLRHFPALADARRAVYRYRGY